MHGMLRDVILNPKWRNAQNGGLVTHGKIEGNAKKDSISPVVSIARTGTYFILNICALAAIIVIYTRWKFIKKTETNDCGLTVKCAKAT